MSMAHSLEIRVPFGDQELVKIAGSILLRQKAFQGGQKLQKGLFSGKAH